MDRSIGAKNRKNIRNVNLRKIDCDNKSYNIQGDRTIFTKFFMMKAAAQKGEKWLLRVLSEIILRTPFGK